MVNSAELVFVRLLIPLVAGIICFSGGLPPSGYLMMGCMAATMLIGLGFTGYYFKHLKKKHRIFVSGGFYLFCFLLGGWLSASNHQLRQGSHFSHLESSYLKVQISDEPQIKNNIIRLRTKVLQSITGAKMRNVSGQLLLSVQLDTNRAESMEQQVIEAKQRFSYGDQLYVPANYEEITEPRNPYEFDVQRWYRRQNFYHQLFVQEDEVLADRKGMGNPIIAWALRLREQQVQLFRRLIRDDEANAVASTLILGYRADLSEETRMAYSKTGTIHALSVSGMHVALIYVIINFMLSFLNRWPAGRIAKLIIAVGLIWLYAIIAGLAPSVLRSAIMLTIFILGSTFNRSLNTYNLLCFSAFIMLLFNPYALYDVGFQLSYLSVFGLMFLQPLIYAWFHFDNYFADKLWSFIALSSAAQIATFPLAIYYFHQFPVYFLLSNLFILLPVTAIMYVGLVILICRLEFLGPAFDWLISFTNQGLKWIADLPWASRSGIWIDETELLLLSLALVSGCMALLYYNKRLLYVSIVTISLLFLSFSFAYYQTHQQTRIIFFSLRNHAATAFIHQDRAWLLTTLPANSKAFRSFVNPALEQSGVTQVTYLDLHKPFSSAPIQLRDHQIVFAGYKMLLADTCFNGKTLSHQLKVNVINLSLHTKLNLEQLLTNCKAEQLIIDGSNSSYRTKGFENVAHNYDLPVYNLKIKKAYLVNLTQ